MCFIDALLHLFRMFFILPLIRLGREIIRLTRYYRPYTIFVFAACYIFFIFLCLLGTAFILLFIFFLIGFIALAIPLLITVYDWFVSRYRTHATESQAMQYGFLNIDPDPEAPLLTDAQQRSIINIPPPTAVWSTEPLRQQLLLTESEIHDNIYRRSSPTRCPKSRKRDKRSKKRDRTSKGTSRHQCDFEEDEVVVEASMPRRRRRADTWPDNQQPGSSSESPFVAIDIPDIEVDPPTDSSESSEQVKEPEYNWNPHSACGYGTSTVRSSKETEYDETSLTSEMSHKTPVKRFPDKDYKDSKYTKTKKILTNPEDASTSKETSVRKSEKTLPKQKDQHKYTISSKEGLSFDKKYSRKSTESSSQTNVHSAQYLALDLDERPLSRSSESGTGETTLSESESPASSRHSSPGGGRTPKFEDTPKVHISRKSSRNS